MYDEKRFDVKPTCHLRSLIDSIKDGKLKITYYDSFDQSFDREYAVSTEGIGVDMLVGKYETLTSILKSIGQVRGQTQNGADVEQLLSAEQLEVWNIYLSDFDESFDAGEYDLDQIYEMRECGAELDEGEREVIERHYEWFEAQCLTRLPMRARSPMYLINRAQRYEYFASMGAPELVLEEEGRCLAEELILYYCSV